MKRVINIFLPLFMITSLLSCTKECEEELPDCVVELEKSLLAYYPFNGNANDESGNGNHGVTYGAFFTTDFLGRPNRAAGFDGINDHIIVADNGKLAPPEMTISLMVMLHSVNRRHSLLNHVDFETGRAATYGVGPALDITNKWQFSAVNLDCGTQYLYDANDYITASDGLQAGRWYHVVATFSRGEQKLYVDGQLKASQKRSFNTLANCSAAELVIGAWWKNDVVSIDGKIDELRIYGRGISDCELKELSRVFQ